MSTFDFLIAAQIPIQIKGKMATLLLEACTSVEAFRTVRDGLVELGAQPAAEILEQSAKAVAAGRYESGKQLAEVSGTLT